MGSTAALPTFHIQSPVKRVTPTLSSSAGHQRFSSTAAAAPSSSSTNEALPVPSGGHLWPIPDRKPIAPSQQQQQQQQRTPVSEPVTQYRSEQPPPPRSPSSSSVPLAPPGSSAGLPSHYHQPTSAKTTTMPSTSASTTSSMTTGGGVAGVGGGATAIPDAELISDILFMWMGVERTKFLRYHPTTQQFEVFNSQLGSVRQRHAVQALQDCGLLVMDIDRALSHQVASRAGGLSSSEAPSFLQQSLRAAVREQVYQYQLFVGTLRERASQLTFADLVVAQKKVVPKLEAMSLLLSETAAAKGGELVTKMQTLVFQGSRRLGELMHQLYLQTITPLLQMAGEWMISGEVTDPFQEFFIKVNASVEVSSDMFWSHRFALEPQMLPVTLVAVEVAEDILRVGRNIVFLTRCCRAKSFRMDPTIAARARQLTFESLPAVVADALAFTDRAVMMFVHETSMLTSVLHVVQDFILVGNGDFFEQLIGKLDPLLSKHVAQVQASIVAEHVHLALLEVVASTYASSSSGGSGRHQQSVMSQSSLPTATTAANGNSHNNHHAFSELIGLVETEMIKVENQSGWDCFALTLPLPSPLNNIYDSESKKAYRKLFKCLFAVKRAEVLLKGSWRHSVVLDRLLVQQSRRHSPDDHDLAIWKKVAVDAHLLGLQCFHFVTNLWSYFVSEVSTAAWERLRKAIAACRSFEQVRHAHTAYVQQLSLFCLLHNDCRDVREHIHAILGLTWSICAAQSALTNLLEHRVGDILSIASQYQQMADTFQQHMNALLALLEEQSRFEFMNFLLLRLNFNQFYRRDTASTYQGKSRSASAAQSDDAAHSFSATNTDF